MQIMVNTIEIRQKMIFVLLRFIHFYFYSRAMRKTMFFPFQYISKDYY